MVDDSLPYGSLRYLFLDLNAYFASVEQQERPELRGRPIAVVPVMADSSFCIAVSYEAKRMGVKTLSQIGEARRLCPEIQMVLARPHVYVGYHHRVIAAVESVLPVEKVCSIDEMRIRLLGEERRRPQAIEWAHRIKATIRDQVGECLKSSIGLAPNAFLAKTATDMQKPDGLVVIEKHELPERLFGLKLTDFAGINKRMQIRLNAAGIFTTEQMCRASRDDLVQAFGGVMGERWWHLLRGDDLNLDNDSGKSLSHSHVLPPELRTDQGCREVLMRLIQKASARLRSNGWYAKSMSISVSGFTQSWSVRLRITATQDSIAFNEHFLKAWAGRNFVKPRQVSVVFGDLLEREEVTPSLFDTLEDREDLNKAVDEINGRFGKNTIFLAGLNRVKDTAAEKIAFNKTKLFVEGKGDHEWVDTFRGLATKED
ncbi:MAG: DNA polymerase [Fimbriimonas sp.]